MGNGERRRAVRLPGKGARAILTTPAGTKTGELVNYSETGALIKAYGDGLTGTRVTLRVEEPGKVWERKGTVMWVNAMPAIAIAFEASNSEG